MQISLLLPTTPHVNSPSLQHLPLGRSLHAQLKLSWHSSTYRPQWNEGAHFGTSCQRLLCGLSVPTHGLQAHPPAHGHPIWTLTLQTHQSAPLTPHSQGNLYNMVTQPNKGIANPLLAQVLDTDPYHLWSLVLPHWMPTMQGQPFHVTLEITEYLCYCT